MITIATQAGPFGVVHPSSVHGDGKVYTVTGDLAANNNAKLVPHMSHKVELTGDVTEAGGTITIAATSLKMISK